MIIKGKKKEQHGHEFHFSWVTKRAVCSVAQLCLTLCDPMNCSQAPVCGILQARILGYVAISDCRGSSWPRDGASSLCVSCTSSSSSTTCMGGISAGFLKIITLRIITILLWFLPYIGMNQPWVHMCLPILNLPPTPSLCPRAPALSTLLHALNLHWSSTFHMVIYMFRCYSRVSSHPHLLPHIPKSVLYICLSCCLAYRIVVTIFLNSIYMC